MTYMIDRYGGKTTILAGLLMQALQLMLLGFCQRAWMMWLSGIIASFSSITYPAISAYISTYADADKQGLVQGLITGVRSLCGGIGPAMFGLLFNIFDVDMYEEIKANPINPHTAQDLLKPFMASDSVQPSSAAMDTHLHSIVTPSSGLAKHPQAGGSLVSGWIVGPPFLFGSILVLLAAIAATFIPDTIMPYRRQTSNHRSTSPSTSYYRYTTISSGNFENGSALSQVSHHQNQHHSTAPSSSLSSNGNGMILSSTCDLLEDIEE